MFSNVETHVITSLWGLGLISTSPQSSKAGELETYCERGLGDEREDVVNFSYIKNDEVDVNKLGPGAC